MNSKETYPRAIQADRIVLPDGILEDAILLMENGHITSVGDTAHTRLPAHAALNDASGLTLLPGLIDIHTHGICGATAVDGTPAVLDQLSRGYAAHGVTGFLTTLCGAQNRLEAGIRAVTGAAAGPAGLPGATLLGIHLEGPYLNPQRPGVLRPEHLRLPDVDHFQRLLDLANGQLRLITIAPELGGALEIIRLAVAAGVVCAAGHTDASFEETERAVEAGLTHVTHTFNAMRPLNQRAPGVLGAALTDGRLSAELIADGIHLHPAVLKMVARLKGPQKTVLVSDSIAAAGMPDGEYEFEEQVVSSQAGRVARSDGTLAGSALTLEKAVFNMVQLAGVELAQAVRMASLAPAAVLGIQTHKGSLEAGKDADITAVDEDGRLRWTMVGGRIVSGSFPRP